MGGLRFGVVFTRVPPVTPAGSHRMFSMVGRKESPCAMVPVLEAKVPVVGVLLGGVGVLVGCSLLMGEHKSPKIIAFNSSKDAGNPYRAFSNHYLCSPPFNYVVPFGTMTGTMIPCEHANKALHCTKASIFGDKANF